MKKTESSSAEFLMPGFLPLDQAAAWCGVSVRTLKRWIATGLPKYQARPGSKVLIRPNDIEKFLTRKECCEPNLNAMIKDVCKDLGAA